MKKVNLPLLLLFLLFLFGCDKDNLIDKSGTTHPTDPPLKSMRWYGTKIIADPTTKGIVDRVKLWNQNAPITIKFLNTPKNLEDIEKVKTYAREWQEYAGIDFKFVDTNEKAVVRIAFSWNGNDWLSWSYTGSDARFVKNQNEPTAVLASLEYLSEEEQKGDILRLFGQILGLELEQRHPDWDSTWWKKNSKGEYYAENYWKSQFEELNFDWETIREYVFDPLSKDNSIDPNHTQELDERSVMMWPYYTRKETTKLIANYQLSETDKAFIKKLYPPKTLPTIQVAWVDAGFFTWTSTSKNQLRMTELGKQQEFLPDVSDGEQLVSAESMFFLNTKLKKAPLFNTSNIRNFDKMFAECYSLTSIPTYNTSKGVNFGDMFRSCTSLKAVTNMDTSNGQNFAVMFYECSSLSEIPNINTAKGTNFSNMFGKCRKLENIPLIDTSNGWYFNGMFEACTLKTIPNLNTSKGVDFNNMFKYCSLLEKIPLIDTSNGISFASMFRGCRSLTTIPNINTANATNLRDMFSDCSSLKSIPFLITDKCENFSGMFFGCDNLPSIPKLNTSSGTNFDGMFSACDNLISIPKLETNKGISFKSMFENCSSLTNVPLLDLSKGTHFNRMFRECTSLKEIGNLNLENGLVFYQMFLKCKSLQSDIKFNTPKGVDFSQMFTFCDKLKNVVELDTSNGETFNQMFYDCYNLVSVPNFNTSKGENFRSMLYNTALKNKPNIHQDAYINGVFFY